MKPLGTVAELASNWAGNGAKSATLSRVEHEPVSRFLARGRVCKGPVCLSSNPNGLTRTPETFALGFDVCDICANTMSAGELAAVSAEQKGAKEAKREEGQPRMARMGADKPPPAPRLTLWQQLTQRKGKSVAPRPQYLAVDKEGKTTPHVVGHRTGHTGTVRKDEFSDFTTKPIETGATSRPAEPVAQAAGRAKAILPRAAKPKTQPTHVAGRESAPGAPRRSGVAQRARDDGRGGVDFLAGKPEQKGAKEAKKLDDPASLPLLPSVQPSSPPRKADQVVRMKPPTGPSLGAVIAAAREIETQDPRAPLTVKLTAPKGTGRTAVRTRALREARGAMPPSLVPSLYHRLKSVSYGQWRGG